MHDTLSRSGGILAGLVLAAALSSGAVAGEGLPTQRDLTAKVEPALAPDPAVEAVLKGLGENQSALLPAVKTVGNMSEEVRKFRMDKTGPRPRDYCLKWVWAPDRKRALFCGGNAGVPHKLNDVWEYDLAANTWVLLWEPDPDTNRVRHMKPEEAKAYLDAFVTVDKASGEIMTKRGAPFDPVHTWWGLTYDPELHALLWVMGNHHLHDYFMKTRPELAGDYKLGGYHRMRLWAYYPFEHRWEFMKVPTEPLKSPAAILEYIPELKGSLWYTATHKQTAVFQSKDKSWTGFAKLAPNEQTWVKLTDFPRAEAVAAYDAANKVLVAHLGGNTRNGQPTPKCTYHYTPASNKWERAVESDEGPVGYDSKGPMAYDSSARRCYVVHDGLWSYRVEDKKWEKLTPQGPPPPYGMACYNPDRNVLMVDSGKGQVWVYRGRKTSPPEDSK